jgi:hypothetical protein
MGDDVERAQSRRLLSVLDLEFLAELAEELRLAVLLRNLAGDEEQIAGAHSRHVVAGRRAGVGQGDPEFLEAGVDPSSHVSSPGLANDPIPPDVAPRGFATRFRRVGQAIVTA